MGINVHYEDTIKESGYRSTHAIDLSGEIDRDL